MQSHLLLNWRITLLSLPAVLITECPTTVFWWHCLISCLNSKAGLEPHLCRLCGGGEGQWGQNEARTAASYCQWALLIHCTVQGGSHWGPRWHQKTTRTNSRGQREPQRGFEYESGQTDRKRVCVSQPWRNNKTQCKRWKKKGLHVFKMLFLWIPHVFLLYGFSIALVWVLFYQIKNMSP